MAKTQTETKVEGIAVVMLNPTMLRPREYVSGLLFGKVPYQSTGAEGMMVRTADGRQQHFTAEQATVRVKTQEYADFLVSKGIARYP